MTPFGKDVPIDRPNPGQRAAVFVPRADGDPAVTDTFKKGSGMVGFGNRDGSVMVYFENNRFDDSALQSWQNKVFKSNDRMVKGVPTVNKTSCDAANLEQVGVIEGQEILVRNMDALLAWLARSGAAESAPEGSNIHA